MLSPIVRSSRSFAEVMRRLGLPPSGGNYRQLAARIRQAAIDISHFGSRTFAARCAAIPREVLEELVPQCLSVAQVLAKLELPTEGRAHRELTLRIRELAIDTTHFRGRGWSRGETRTTHASVDRISERNTWSDADVFVENSPVFQGSRLAKRLIALGWTYGCAWCGISEWRGRPLVLHLDHINGISKDNRRENLRFLCPNCHSQTETYSNRRRVR